MEGDGKDRGDVEMEELGAVDGIEGWKGWGR